MRSSIHRPRLVLPGVTAVALAACSSATTDAPVTVPDPAFTIAIGASALSLAPGGSAATFVKATRSGGLTGAIVYTVTGAPAGLSAAVVGTNVPDSSALTVTASATLAAGTYPIVVNAAASGTIARQAAAAVTVIGPPGVAPAIEFVVTGEHTCALTIAGAAYCWGSNADGQLGNNGTSLDNPIPVAVDGGLAFKSLSVSKVEGVSCGLTNSGEAYCWGRNDGDQIGDNTTTRRLAPTRVAGGLTFKSIAVGNTHVCAVAIDGTTYCWGSTVNGAFGDGTIAAGDGTLGVHRTPAVAALGMSFQSVVAGSDYTCGLTPGGAAFCWGLGFNGQLGIGLSTISTTPVPVSGGLTFRSLAAGGLSVCGLTTAGKAYCWGDNFYGTGGDGTSGTEGGTARHLTPVAVAGGLTFQTLSAGYETMCGVTDTGAAYCWGYNFGAVGDGSLEHRSSPVAVAGGLAFHSVSGGTGYACGVTTTNTVYCWGDNSNGALGDGTFALRPTPVPVRWP